MTDSGTSLEHMGANWAIQQALTRYCHGVDRCDLDMLKSAFWDDAVADYGFGEIPATLLCENLIPSLKEMELTHHRISNILIELDGVSAKVETYCVAFHLVGPPEARQEMEVGGRYLDDFRMRGGEWRIASRLYVMDWNRNAPSTMQTSGELYAQLKHRGARHPGDPYDAFMRA